jgi:antitoxin component YwqK of YwqJK toxin-antitoxin module
MSNIFVEKIKDPITNTLLFVCTYNENKELHSYNDEPASVEYFSNGKKHIEKWYLNGILHRNGKPAYIEHFRIGVNKHHIEKWYQDGKLHRNNKPAHIEYKNDKHNTIKLAIYYQNGNLVN